jgi:preprotein translocase subunit SecG
LVYILYALFFISCLALIGAVLLQPGKTDAGALFTSNVSSSAFSPRGTATVLSKVTIAAATIFMLSALFLAMPALNGNVSVLSSNPDAPADATVPADANANTANANSAPANVDANAAAPLTNANAAPAANSSDVSKPAANAPAANAAANKPAANAPSKTTTVKSAANKK